MLDRLHDRQGLRGRARLLSGAVALVASSGCANSVGVDCPKVASCAAPSCPLGCQLVTLVGPPDLYTCDVVEGSIVTECPVCASCSS